MKNFKMAFNLVWRSAPLWTIANIILIVIEGFFSLIILYLMKLIIDGLTLSVTASDRFSAFKQVGIFIFLICLVIFFNFLLNSFGRFIREQQVQFVTDYISNLIHSKSIILDFEYYENPKYYNTLHRAQREGMYRPIEVLDAFIQFIQNVVFLIKIAVLLFTFHYIIPLLFLFIFLPSLIIRLKYSHKRYNWYRRMTSIERKSFYLQWLLTNQSTVKEIKVFMLGELLMERFKELRALIRKERKGIALKQLVVEIFVGIISILAIFCFYFFLAFKVIYGAFTIGSVVMYYQAFQRVLRYHLFSLYLFIVFCAALFCLFKFTSCSTD
ncbi:MAG: hypothetical protein NC925_02310 [Candidatus Omnitrophica bacterium]|nr:hypothetical protein [Candidatus Omnitrophota bacterium]